MEDLAAKINSVLLIMFGAIFSFVIKRLSDDNTALKAKVEEIEKHLMPREEIRAMHADNMQAMRDTQRTMVETLRSIEARFESFAEKSMNDRHNLRDRIGQIALDVALVAKDHKSHRQGKPPA